MDDRGQEHLYSPDEIKRHQGEKIAIGRQVRNTIKSDGWKLFLALYRKKAIEIREKDDYPSLEDFRADRRGLAFVRQLIDEFRAFEEDAEAASQTLIQLHKAESRTPTPLSFDIGKDPDETREEG